MCLFNRKITAWTNHLEQIVWIWVRFIPVPLINFNKYGSGWGEWNGNDQSMTTLGRCTNQTKTDFSMDFSYGQIDCTFLFSENICLKHQAKWVFLRSDVTHDRHKSLAHIQCSSKFYMYLMGLRLRAFKFFHIKLIQACLYGPCLLHWGTVMLDQKNPFPKMIFNQGLKRFSTFL